ncbi:MAG: hypothetical protein IKU30_01470 [Clostridia bacterium]|nr:hypothetical protein [Clostridia bacterium]
MYICKPERNVAQTRLLLITCAVVTLSIFFISTVVPAYNSLVETFGFLSLVVSILLVYRYSMTEFEYGVTDCDFTVTKIVGNKRTPVCCVALETAIDLLTKSDYTKLSKNEKAITKYSLKQNMFANSYVFLCDFNERRAMIEFEPNIQFVMILKNAIKNAKHQSENSESNDI